MNINDPRLSRVLEAASLQRDIRLAKVAAMRNALAQSIGHRDRLDPLPLESQDPVLHVADLRHRIWAEDRRRVLAPMITAQELALRQQAQDAARSVARCQVLDRLIKKRRDQAS